jgi:hypothetical protein
MKMASVIILALVGVAMLLIGFESANIAYRSNRDQYGSVTMAELTAGKPDVELALRARRGTAASFAAGFATFFLMIVLGPYRRGDRWAWWAILVGTVVLTGLLALRFPMLDLALGAPANTGAGTARGGLIILGLVAVGLALGAGRLKSASS